MFFQDAQIYEIILLHKIYHLVNLDHNIFIKLQLGVQSVDGKMGDFCEANVPVPRARVAERSRNGSNIFIMFYKLSLQ